MKLKLKKDIVIDKTLSNNAILAYVGIVSCFKNDFDNVFTNKNMMTYYLTKKTVIPRRFEESLRNGINELLKNKIIICDSKNGTDFYMDTLNIKLKDDDIFIYVDLKDIQKILSCYHQSKIGLLRYYILVLGTFISKNHVENIRDPNRYNNVLGMMSQEYISNLTGMSIHTVAEYTKILEELEILYVSRCSFMFKDNKGVIKRHNNIYGRYKDKDIIDEFTKARYEMYDDLHKTHLSSAANNSRSLMQKYNQMVNGRDYDDGTVKDIYEYICKYNKKHTKNKKDMNVFVKCGYDLD